MATAQSPRLQCNCCAVHFSLEGVGVSEGGRRREGEGGEGGGRWALCLVHVFVFACRLCENASLSQVHSGPEQRARGRFCRERGSHRSESWVRAVGRGEGRRRPRCVRATEEMKARKVFHFIVRDNDVYTREQQRQLKHKCQLTLGLFCWFIFFFYRGHKKKNYTHKQCSKWNKQKQLNVFIIYLKMVHRVTYKLSFKLIILVIWKTIYYRNRYDVYLYI